MSKQPGPKLPKNNIKIYSENYVVRTLKVSDASDRWAEWMRDAEVMYMMNMPARDWTQADIASYIKQFDQRSRLLLGIFEKVSWRHIGIVTVELRVKDQYLLNALIGEPQYRNKGVASEIAVPCGDYFLETMGLTVGRATVLGRNPVINHYLRKIGFKLDGVMAGYVKSHADGTMLDLCLYSITRDEWRRWKANNLVRKS
jgi:RimJ/RimL family protein N-acetyltransferase